MPFRIIEDEAIADVAFEAWGPDIADVFQSAADAMLSVMVEEPESVQPTDHRRIEASHGQPDLLLHDVLQRLIYFKDAEQLLLVLSRPTVVQDDGMWRFNAEARGERIDRGRHALLADVKAVTLHDLRVRWEDGMWRAHVVLDV